MQYIKAPYNFVPVSNKVVFPEWRNAVSHDIPFRDGESGTISVKIKAESPIFTRNGHTQNQKENVTDFSNHKGKYFIPGSSIRGSIRNVLEILTFSKMEKVDDTKYSVRDFRNKNLYPIPDISKNSRAGWLFKENGEYKIIDCGEPGRISHTEIDNHYGTNLRSFFLRGGGFSGRNEQHKTAKFKYDMFGKQNSLSNNFERTYPEKENKADLRKFFRIEQTSDKRGEIVFTGQAGPRKEPDGDKPSGKLYEFIFFDTNKEPEIVDDKVIENFFFAYFDHDKNQQSEDWKERKKQLDKGDRIPVFFRREGKEIKDMGLSFLYKITYENSVKDLLSDDHIKHEPDFAETIFGYINDETKQALKGRVHFEHAFNTNNAELEKLQNEALSGPKASYYPNYIRQNTDKNGKVIGNYQTFMNKNAQLSGWKRYPVHPKDSKPKNNPGTDNVATQFTPLKAGAKFELKIRLHNMRKVEIGALLSTLTFHDTDNTFHGIGMAKPLGYGKSKFEITNITGFENLTTENQTEYMKAFEAYMRGSVNSEWEAQAKELIAISSEQNNKGNSELVYMQMDTKGDNEFVKAKDRNSKEALRKYSELNGVQHNSGFRLLADDDDITEYRNRQSKEADIFKKPNPEQFYDTKINDSNTAFSEKCKNLNSELEEKIKTKTSDLKSSLKQLKAEIDKRNVQSLAKSLEEIADYDIGKDIIKEYQNKLDEIPESEYPAIKDFLKRCYDNMGKKKQKGWSNFNKNPWKYIANTWVGQETAQSWYNEMIDNK